VLRRALADARLQPGDLDYVEAHGTGTPIGDPIELEALGRVIGTGRDPSRPLLVGSVKTNIGHTEAAAGLAGILKVVMALKNEAIPPHLHFNEPNPRFAWDQFPITVPTALTPWTRGERVRRAGVSSFGFSGTNAHVIIEEAPAVAPRVRTESGPVLVSLSARDEESLRNVASRTADFVAENPDASLADVAWTAATGRSHHIHRAAFVAGDATTLEHDLRAFAANEPFSGLTRGVARPGERPQIAFLFTGQGAQYPGMGRGLYEHEPVFRASIDRAAAILAPLLDRPLLEVLFPAEGTSTPLSETAYTQPALFALEFALSELWASWGITPSVVLGHSVGEYVAACVAGVMSFEDGLKLIAERGRLMQALPSGGAMAAIFATEEKVAPRLAGHRDRVAIAAINGPEETVISGDGDAVAELVASFAADGIKSRPLDVSHAFHSPRLDPMLDALERRASAIDFAAPRITLISNLTGAAFTPGTAPDAAYWRRHAREPVRFADCLGALRSAGVTAVVEVGPHPTLLALAGRSIRNAPWTGAASLRRDRDERRDMLLALGMLHTRGASVQWSALAGNAGARHVALPTYPFRRERYWVPDYAARRSTSPAGTHPLLGQRQRSPMAGAQFLSEVDRATPSFLADHVVLEKTLLPGSGYVEMALAAARALGSKGGVAVQNFIIETPLALESDVVVQLHTTVDPEMAGRSSFVVRSIPADDADGEWKVHAKGSLRRDVAATDNAAPKAADARARCTTAIDPAEYYAMLERSGLQYGPTFRGVRALHVGVSEAVGELEAPTDDGTTWMLHPAILDSAFHVVGAALIASQTSDATESVYLPVGIDEIFVNGPAPRRVRVTARVRDNAGPGVHVADLRMEDENGNAVATVTGLQLRAVTPDTLARALSIGGIAQHAYRTRWTEVQLDGAPGPIAGRVVVIADKTGVGAMLGRALSDQGADCTIVSVAELTSPGAITSRLAADSGAPPSWVVDCSAVGASDTKAIPNAVRDAYLHLLGVSQAMATSAPRAGLCVLTRGAQSIAPGDEVDLPRAALLGLSRTIGAERADAPSVRIDLDPAAPADVQIRPLLHALASVGSYEPELGIRSGNVFAPRLDDSHAAFTRPAGVRDVLRVRERGSLEALHIVQEPRRAPGAGEVEVEIRATGLNFRDVLNALGMYPGDPGPMGSECSGIITAVGEGMTGLAVGDEVIALGADSFASHLTVSDRLVVPKPATIGFADAVTLPNTYLTAAEAFASVGGIKRGQRVLVHAAAGGVGLAALRLATRIGAEVIATAGSAEKRAFTIAQGATHAFDSRSASFADDVQRVTNGAGVDFVLNALSGDLITAGMRVLRPGGAFVEIGKNGIWTPAEAAERAPHARYQIVDLGVAIQEDINRVRRMLVSIVNDVAAGRLQPLPVRAFPLSDALSAFRYMATARHTGKVVLMPARDTEQTLMVRPNATYLVTGGLGGLGFAAAEWLADRGATDIVLTSRREPRADEQQRIELLRARNVRVTSVACDVGDRASVQALWRDTLATRPALRGIVHTAGVLADAPLGDQDAERFAAVAHAKVQGAWNLHEASSRSPLDFFALFSSSSALFGSPGQANYSAANAFLDGLAAFRHARGKVATSIGWGAWGEVGMAARMSDAQRSRLSRLGSGFIAPAEALEAFGRAVVRPEAHVAIVSLDPARIAAQAGPGLRALLGLSAAATPAADAAPTQNPLVSLEMVRSVSPAERVALLRPYVHQEAARVLGFKASALDVETPLSALGFDSLMAVQFRNRVENDLAVDVPLAQLLSGPTVVQLTEELAARLGGVDTVVMPAPAAIKWEEGSL
jgi:acyl transferase domain-containing protein/acyl carrier protein